MFYRRTGFPEEDELVLCTVTKIFPHAVFCSLDEFDRSGVIHISEIAPGRIRNIRDYVKDDKKIICKVLRTDEQKGHIDLSLRRVNESQKRNKKDEIKKEILAEKIVESVARILKQDTKKLYNQITDKVFEKYFSLYSCFQDVIDKKITLENLGIEKKLASEMVPFIEQRIKPPEVCIEGNIKISSHEPNGVEIIKKALSSAKKISKDIGIRYDSAGNYNLNVKAGNYQDAEKILKQIIDSIKKEIESFDCEVDFVRKK